MATISQLVRMMTPVAKAVLTGAPNAPRLGYFITGAPGGGKSALAWSLGAILTKELGFDVPVFEIRGPSLADPSFVTGMPDVTGTVTTLKRMNLLPPENTPCVLLIDELGATHQQIRSALTQLIYDKKAGEYKLDPRTFIICTGNRHSDRAASTKVETHVANRLRHFELETNLQEWQSYIADKGLPHLLIAFLEQRPDLLHKFDPKSEELAFPSPRTWEEVAIDMSLLTSSDDVLASAASLVGSGPAAELAAFVERAAVIPSWKEFRALAAGDAAAIIKRAESSVQYAAMSMIASNAATKDDIDWGIEVVDACSPELVVAMLNMAVKVFKKSSIVLTSRKATEFIKTKGVQLFA